MKDDNHNKNNSKESYSTHQYSDRLFQMLSIRGGEGRKEFLEKVYLINHRSELLMI